MPQVGSFLEIFISALCALCGYYSIKLIGEEYVSEGVLQDEEYESKYEMGILNDSNEAILMNIHTYNMYYCFRR